MPDDKDRRDERAAAGEDADDTMDENLNQSIAKFQNQLKNTSWYRFPLKYLVDIGLVNTQIKFNTKWRLTFETNMQKLFESKTNQTADGLPDTVDAKIFLESVPYLLFYQFLLEDTYRTYFEGAMISEQVLRTGIK